MTEGDVDTVAARIESELRENKDNLTRERIITRSGKDSPASTFLRPRCNRGFVRTTFLLSMYTTVTERRKEMDP